MKMLLTWIFQLVAAAVVLPAGLNKIVSKSCAVALFTSLGMEPVGRLLIGALEVLAGLFLLTNCFAVFGAFLSFCIMLGAIIAYVTLLKTGLMYDYHLITLVVSSLGVMILRKREFPFFPKKDTPY